jgi:hypothetical protein
VPITVSKLVSPQTLSSLDYSTVPICSDTGNSNQKSFTKMYPKSLWQQSMQALHGDIFYSIEQPFQIRMLEDVYCQHACYINLDVDDTTTSEEQHRHNILNNIRHSFRYNWYVDHLPAATMIEDE